MRLAFHRRPKRWAMMGIALALIAGAEWAATPGRIFSPAAAEQPANSEPLPDFADRLPRIAPLEVDEALDAFELLPGFRIELVAAEPLVVDPIAMDWDARGRLFVIEMRDYSEMAEDHTGRVALLEDTNGDGQLDHRSTFVEGLSWPTAIQCWGDGVLVAHPPHLSYFRDTQGDGRADRQDRWYTGFSRANVQGMVNSLRWTPSGFIHGATSSAGASLVPDPNEGEGSGQRDPHELKGMDFELDPITRQLRPASGGGQHGLVFNRWGEKFVCSNSDHLQQVIDLEPWLARGVDPSALPRARRSIAADGPQAEVYRASPVEPWRTLRTELRVSGAVPGIVEGGGRAAGYFTGATGVWVVDAAAGLGAVADGRVEPYDTALVCDVGGNLVHRKRLLPEGLFYRGERVDEETELVRSRDIWFRPVQLGDGPDGHLYILDMYREVIEHPASLPPSIKRHLDLNSGNDRGRIWRLVSERRRAAPFDWSLADKSDAELLELLDHPFAWQRRAAARLLVERSVADSTLSAAALRQAVDQRSTTEGRFWTLQLVSRLGADEPAVWLAALEDPHERIRALAVEKLHPYAGDPRIAAALAARAEDRSLQVRWRLALLANQWPADVRRTLQRTLLESDEEPVRTALLAQMGADALPLLQRWLTEGAASETAVRAAQRQSMRVLLSALARHRASLLESDADSSLAALRHAGRSLVAELTSDDEPEGRWQPLVLALAELPPRQSRQLSDLFALDPQGGLRERIDQWLAAWIEEHEDSEAAAAASAETAAALAAFASAPTSQRAVRVLLQPRWEATVQRAALRGVRSWSDTRLPSWWFEAIRGTTDAVRAEAVQVILERPAWAKQLVEQLREAVVPLALINAEARQRLAQYPQEDVAQQFTALIEASGDQRSEAAAAYVEQAMKARQAGGLSRELGERTFRRVCVSCHRIGEEGHDVGPPLNNLADKSDEQLLQAIVYPNREVDPRYLTYQVLLREGTVVTGIVRDETSETLSVQESGGRTVEIRRAEIDRLQTGGLSLMPEGLHEQVPPDQMAALLEFLRSPPPSEAP